MSASSTNVLSLPSLFGVLLLSALSLNALTLGGAEASVFESLSLEDLVDRADLIVEGRVAKRNYRSVARNGVLRLETFIELEIQMVHAGEAGDILNFTLPGGKGGGREQIYLGVPELSPREEILAFFSLEGGSPQLLGWVQGVYRISRDMSGGVRARRDDVGVSISRRGRLSHQSNESIPLDELRAAIAARIALRSELKEQKGRRP